MTESFRTPLSFNLIKESSEDQKDRTIERADVVLISFANDYFYLNCPQGLNQLTGQYEEQEMKFHRWQDSKNIDFNGWWQIDVLDDPSMVTFKNFNSGKYICCPDKNSGDCPLSLVEDQKLATKFKITAINSDQKDVNSFTVTEIFKIKAVKEGKGELYLNIEPSNDSGENFFGDSNLNTKKVLIKNKKKHNTLDSFKFIIPKEEDYMELSL